MSGTWEEPNKVLPGAYINIRTNEPLSITPGDRGIVAILQEMSVGEDKKIYHISATASEWPSKATATDKLLVGEALKKAQAVLLYKLPKSHTPENITEALVALKTQTFNLLCYPYDEGNEANKTAIAAWITMMREEEGVKCQAVLANHTADNEAVINVVQGIIMSDSTKLTAAQVTAWVAGATAGASILTSNTGMTYGGAIDVEPRMSRTEMEAAVTAGKFTFKVDSVQNVSAVYDINSKTTVTAEKGKMFSKNRIVRTLDNIANDVVKIFEANYIGKVNNDESGHSLLKAYLVDYFTTLQGMGAIQNFEVKDVTVEAGAEKEAVMVTCNICPIDSVEKIYITVNLS